jgi:hypothetical protein
MTERKTPARRPAFSRDYAIAGLVAVVVVMIVIVIIALIIVTTVLPADVMAVDPMVPLSHVAWNPGHFIVALPIARAMAVEWLVANFDANSLRLNGGPESKTRSGNRHE